MQMEVSGMQLYDREVKEIAGIALQEAYSVAKATYPISRRMYPCRAFVGQESVPFISASTSTSE